MSAELRDLRSPEGKAAGEVFSYSLKDIDQISEQLGIPWQKKKDCDFSDSFTFTGFLWNIPLRTVTLPEAKKAKYRQAILDWNKSRTHILHEVQKLHGKLLHVTQIVLMG